MMIYIDIAECKDSTGKVVAVAPNVGIQINVDEDYNIFKLRGLEDKLQSFLNDELNACLS